jgi:hypothetical protein
MCIRFYIMVASIKAKLRENYIISLKNEVRLILSHNYSRKSLTAFMKRLYLNLVIQEACIRFYIIVASTRSVYTFLYNSCFYKKESFK